MKDENRDRFFTRIDSEGWVPGMPYKRLGTPGSHADTSEGQKPVKSSVAASSEAPAKTTEPKKKKEMPF